VQAGKGQVDKVQVGGIRWVLFYLLLVYLSTLLTAACTGPGATSTPVPTSPLVAGKRVQFVGHRGAAGLAPENTLAAFAKGIEAGVDAIECDVHLSADGALIVMHDPNVSRTTDGSGDVPSLTLAELKKLNAAAKFTGGWPTKEPVPTLAEVLALAQGKVDVQIEIKVPALGGYPGIERKVAEAVAAADMVEHVLVICFNLDTLRTIHAADPRLRTGYLVSESTVPAQWLVSRSAMLDALKESGVGFLGSSAAFLSPELVQAAHERGLTVGVWTIDTAGDMRRFAAMGVDAITTNRPDVLRQTLGK